MKIYLVIGSFDYEDSFILGAFSTAEKAEVFLERQKKLGFYDTFKIENYEIDHEG